MLGTKNECPNCGYTGDPKPTDNYCIGLGYDPLMIEVQCKECGLKYNIAPPPWHKEGEKENAERDKV